MSVYNSNLDLRGRKLKDTYQNVVQYDSVNNVLTSGVGVIISPAFSGSGITGNVSSSSYSNLSTSSSYSDSSSYALTASYVSGSSTSSESSSYALTSSYAKSSSYSSVIYYNATQSLNLIQSASYASSSISSSYSLVAQSVLNAITSASYSVSSSYALNGGSGGGTTLTTGSTYPITSSWSQNVISASYSPVNPQYSASVSLVKQDTLLSSGSYPISSSWSDISFVSITSSVAVNAVNATTSDFSNLSNTAATASVASTASYFSGSIQFSSGIYDLTASNAISSSYFSGSITFGSGIYDLTASNAISSSYSSTGPFVKLSGDTMTGNLVISQSNLQIGSTDVILVRDAANTLALKNTGSAQTLNIYNTYTDESNYERGFLKWSGNYLYVGTDKLGTGTSRGLILTTGDQLYLQSGGSSRWFMPIAGHFFAITDNTYDIGASGANRPRSVYVGTTLYAATTVQSPQYKGNLGSRILEQADGVWQFGNSANTDFSRLQFGGTTSSFPAIKRYSGSLNARLADDSADCPLTSSALLISSGSINFTTSSAAPANTGSIVQWTTVVVAGITYKMPLYL